MLDWFKLSRREALHLCVIVVVVLPLFLWTGHWKEDGNADTLAVSIPAWEYSQNASLDLSHRSSIAENIEELNRWFVPVDNGRIVSNRAPGLIWMAIPAYLLLTPPTFTSAPATFVALIATLVAIILLWQGFRKLVSLTFATSSAIVMAVGTTTWFVSSSELWPHGPGQLWAAFTVMSLSAGSYIGVGVAQGLSITTRPLTGIYAAAIGIVESIRKRDWRPVVQIGVISALGLGAVLLYNRLLFGDWSVRGGYPDSFTSGALDRFTVRGYLSNVWEMFFGLPNGVLLSTPIVGISVYGAIRHRRHLKPWMLSLALASILYLIVHAALNRVSGGTPIFYRYPLESLALASPLLVIGSYHLFRSNRLGSVLVYLSAAISVILQVVNVVYFSCLYTEPVIPSCMF